MYEEILKEFKIFREQVYAKFAEYDEILRTLIGSNAEKIVSTFTDENALKVIDLCPVWDIGIAITQDMINKGQNRYQDNGKLYKCIQPHTTQADWRPESTPALWTLIDVTHTGTIDDPIPAVAGMEYAYGKYYIEGETVYICKRTGEAEGGTIVLQFLPSQLVGQYFEIASEV